MEKEHGCCDLHHLNVKNYTNRARTKHKTHSAQPDLVELVHSEPVDAVPLSLHGLQKRLEVQELYGSQSWGESVKTGSAVRKLKNSDPTYTGYEHRFSSQGNELMKNCTNNVQKSLNQSISKDLTEETLFWDPLLGHFWKHGWNNVPLSFRETLMYVKVQVRISEYIRFYCILNE